MSWSHDLRLSRSSTRAARRRSCVSISEKIAYEDRCTFLKFSVLCKYNDLDWNKKYNKIWCLYFLFQPASLCLLTCEFSHRAMKSGSDRAEIECTPRPTIRKSIKYRQENDLTNALGGNHMMFRLLRTVIWKLGAAHYYYSSKTLVANSSSSIDSSSSSSGLRRLYLLTNDFPKPINYRVTKILSSRRFKWRFV